MTTREIARHLELKGFKYNEKTREFINNRKKASCYFFVSPRNLKVYMHVNDKNVLIDDIIITEEDNDFFGLKFLK